MRTHALNNAGTASSRRSQTDSFLPRAFLRIVRRRRRCVLVFFSLAVVIWVSRSVGKRSIGPAIARNSDASDPNVADVKQENEIFANSIEHLLLQEYTQWHQEERKRVLLSRSNRQLRILVYRGRERRGIGDRMRGIIQAYLIAVVTKRLLLIDWNTPFSLGLVFDLDRHANYTYDEGVFSVPRTRWNGRRNSKSVRTATFADLREFSGGMESIGMATNPFPEWDLFLEHIERTGLVACGQTSSAMSSVRRSEYKHEIFSKIIREVLQPSVEQKRRVQDALLGRSGCFSGKRVLKSDVSGNDKLFDVSIHVRLGYEIEQDAPLRFHSEIGNTTLNEICSCVSQMAFELYKTGDKTAELSPTFFVSTDTRGIRTPLAASLMERDANSKVIYRSCSVKHIRDLTAAKEYDKTKFFDTFTDLDLLSSGTTILNIRSGFADAAAWLGGIKVNDKLRCVIYYKCGYATNKFQTFHRFGSSTHRHTRLHLKFDHIS